MWVIDKFIGYYKNQSVIFKATLWFMACSILQKGMSMLTTPIFTRLMSTDEYGLYTTYNSWLNIFTIITTLNLGYGVFNKAMSKFKEDRDSYTSAMQGLTITITTVVFFAYLILRKPINSWTELPTIIMVAMFLELYFAPAFVFWTRRLRYEYKYKEVVLVTLAMTLGNVFFGIAAVYFSVDKGFARIMSIVFVQAAFGIGLTVYNFKRGKRFCVPKFWKFAIGFNLPLLPHYFSMYVLEQSDRVMIQKLCGYSTVAIYGVAYNLGMVMKIIIDSLNNSLIPWLYNSLEEKKFDNIEKKITSISFTFCIGLCLFMLIAPEFLMFFATQEYFEAMYVIPPVTSSILFIFLYNLFGNIEFYYESNKFTMLVSGIGAALNIILNYIFIRMFGFVAAGYTTLVCYMIFSISHYVYSTYVTKKKVGVVIFKPNIMLLFVVGLVFATLLIAVLYHYRLLRYAVIAVLMLFCIVKRKKLLETIKVKK